MSIGRIRREYDSEGLTEAQVAADPIEQFERWFAEAQQADILDPNAMTLATCGADGTPTARIVLLKAFDARGFVFFTSYRSAKSAQLKDNPAATLLFYWDKLNRTVRVTGEVVRVAREESEAYFATRPRDSQLAAWASNQSRPIEDRAALERQFSDAQQRYESQDVPTPPFWGGYRLRPASIEFWQGQPSRLHDRLRYDRRADGTWTMMRLAP